MRKLYQCADGTTVDILQVTDTQLGLFIHHTRQRIKRAPTKTEWAKQSRILGSLTLERAQRFRFQRKKAKNT